MGLGACKGITRCVCVVRSTIGERGEYNMGIKEYEEERMIVYGRGGRNGGRQQMTIKEW